MWKQTLVDHLRKCTTPREIEFVYASMIKKNADQDCFLMNQFVSNCCALYYVDFASSAFSQLQKPNAFVYNAMIRGCVHCSCPGQAMECYKGLLRESVQPNSYTFSSLIKACSLLRASSFGEGVHGNIQKYGLDSHVFVQTALVDFYASIGRILEARKIFDEMPERDGCAWTTIVSAHVRAGEMSSARKLFDEMPERTIASWNTMIDGYARSGDQQSAESLFIQMPERDIISWTTMIACYSQNKQFQEAVRVFKDMTARGMNPDGVTMSTVISACAHLGSLDIGKEIHQYILQNRFHIDVYIGSALVDMYAKCGSLDKSLVVFYKLQEKNLFCWNSVIEGLASHGRAKEALLMFSKMEREKVIPNWVTFVSVLSACSHAGLVEEGRKRFLSLSNDYLISPRVEHYGCMINLLTKAGLLRDALELIRSMKFEPNAVIWGALLGGCKLHKNLEIAQVAADALKILEPENSGYYMLLLNMYAEANRWDEVAKIRATMKQWKVEKDCPGSSWIEIEKKICQFAATDIHHTDSHQIFMLLDELDAQMKLSNSIPEGLMSAEISS